MDSPCEFNLTQLIEVEENNNNNDNNNSLNLSNLIPSSIIMEDATFTAPIINLPTLLTVSPSLLPLEEEEEATIIASTSTLPLFSTTSPTSSSTLIPLNPSTKRPSSSLEEGGEFNAFQNEESQASKSSKSAMEWNTLLSWARKFRGPQWDYSTSQYQVDSNSAEYYAGIERKIDPEAENLLLQEQILLRTTNQNQFYPNNVNNPNIPNNNNGGGGPLTPGNSASRVLGGQLFSNTYNGNNTGVGGTSSGGTVYDSGRPRRTRAAMTGGTSGASSVGGR